MTHHDETRALSALISAGQIAMVTTADPTGLAARPVTCVEATETTLSFLVDRTADWVEPIGPEGTTVAVSFADSRENTYICVSGTARVLPDSAVVGRLWNPAAKAFFDGPEDPHVAALQVAVESGQWWDGPSGRLRQALALVRAAVSDGSDMVGEQGSLDVPGR